MSSIRQPRPEVNVEVIDGGRKPRNTYHPYEYSSDMYYKQEKDDKKKTKAVLDTNLDAGSLEPLLLAICEAKTITTFD